MGNGGGSIMIWVGRRGQRDRPAPGLGLMTKMVHSGLPNLPRASTGWRRRRRTSSPIARARHGHLSVEEVVRPTLSRRTPQGVPVPGVWT